MERWHRARLVACGLLACVGFGRVGWAHDPPAPKPAASKLHDDPVLNRVLLAWSSGQLDEAAALLKKATQAQPDRFEYWAYLGKLQLQRGEDGPHIVRFGNHVAVRPVEEGVSTDSWRQEKLGDALACFEKLVQLRPGYAAGYGYQVICLLGLERFDAAEAVSRRAVAVEPKDPEWQLQLAAVLRMNRKHDEAAATLDAIEKLAPRRGTLHQERLRLAESRDEPAERLQDLRLRAAYFSYLIPTAESQFTIERGRAVVQFGRGTLGVADAPEAKSADLVRLIRHQAEHRDEFAVDLWISIVYRENQDDLVTEAAARALESIGPEANDRLFWVFQNSLESRTALRRVAALLAQHRDGRIYEPLCRFLPYDRDYWPVDAATALGTLGDARVVPVLSRVCQASSAKALDPAAPGTAAEEAGHQMNRRRCVAALRHFDTPEAREVLRKVSDDTQVRSAALASLYTLSHEPRLLEELAAMLRGRQADFRAVHDLALLNEPQAWQLVLQHGPLSENDQVRAHTARAIRYADPTDAQRSQFLATLQKLSADKTRIVAEEARRGLDQLANGME
jgi:tetratricopeptide (TPR) repeat protein